MPSTSSGWIQSKRSRPPNSHSFQTRLVPDNNDDDNNHNNGQEQDEAVTSSPRITPSSSPKSLSITRQSTLVMTKDSTANTSHLALSYYTAAAEAVETTTITTEATVNKHTKPAAVYTEKSSMSGYGNKGTNSKMSSILDRVLDKATNNDNNAAAGAPSRSSRRETRSSVKTAKGGGTQDEQSGDNNNQQTAASTVNITNTVTDNTSNKTGGNSRSKPTATSTPAVASATASRSRKSPSVAAMTSIAERLPKGSRAKPLPPKSSTPPTTTPSFPTSIDFEPHHHQQQQTQAGDKLSQAISLSSSMPSIPSQMEPIDLDEDGDEHMTENSAFYLTLASDDNNDNKSQHPTSATSLNPQQQQQYFNDDKDRGAGAGESHGIDLRKKQPSVISVASSKDEYASIIPSVQVERIANWMGGVKEAMKEDGTIEPNPVALTRQQQPSAIVPAHNNNSNNNSTTTEPPVKAVAVEDSSVVGGSRKPALRRPPPAPARHVVTLAEASPPPTVQAQVEPIDEGIIPSSLSEEEPLQRNYRLGQKIAANRVSGSKGKRVFVEDSLSSLPPVPLFHETSNISESNTHRRRSVGELSTSTALKAAAVVVETRQGSRADSGSNSQYHINPTAAQDDLSTIVGGQAPTQDSFIGPFQSLPSFIYETDEEAHTRTGVAEMEHVQNDPSLPSELTASCLRELGLKRKNVRDRSHGAGKRHAKSRAGYGIRDSNIDKVLEENDDEDENEDEDEGEEESGGIALAQRVAFPSSFDLAPMSTLSSSVTTPPLSLEVIEGPRATYTPAGRTGARTNKENEAGSSAHQYQHADPNLASLPSFPSPPASLVFSTMPSMPTLPTFPSIMHQEPSLIVLDSQTQQTEEEEQTQSQEVDY